MYQLKTIEREANTRRIISSTSKMGVHVQRSVRSVTQPDACLIWQLGAQASFDFVRLRVDQLGATSAMTIFYCNLPRSRTTRTLRQRIYTRILFLFAAITCREFSTGMIYITKRHDPNLYHSCELCVFRLPVLYLEGQNYVSLAATVLPSPGKHVETCMQTPSY